MSEMICLKDIWQVIKMFTLTKNMYKYYAF